MHTSNNKVELFSLLNIPFNHPNNLKKVFKWFRDDSIRRYKIIFDKDLTDNFSDLQQIYEFYPNIRTVTIVTNPWFRLVKTFLYYRGPNIITDNFETFIMNIENYKLNIDILKNQVDYTQCNHNGSIISVDFIIRNEHFGEDFSQLQKHFSTTDKVSEEKNSFDYKRFYNEKTKTKVAELFSRDIEHFGYTF